MRLLLRTITPRIYSTYRHYPNNDLLGRAAAWMILIVRGLIGVNVDDLGSCTPMISNSSLAEDFGNSVFLEDGAKKNSPRLLA
ncbi:MAG: hypothetical protein V3T53_15990 [Phycisphaerales bacterium]